MPVRRDTTIKGDAMIWLVTIPLALVAAYCVLNMAINADMGGGTSNTPYWVMLLASVAILYVAWFHPIRIVFT